MISILRSGEVQPKTKESAEIDNEDYFEDDVSTNLEKMSPMTKQ